MRGFEPVVRAMGVIALAAGLLLGAHQSSGYGQIDWPPDADFKWWMDGTGSCPAGCDNQKYDCPCAVIYPT